MRVLIIAAHPDDEVLGCGGAILKHLQKEDLVSVLIITEGSKFLFGSTVSSYNFTKRKAQLRVDACFSVIKRYTLKYPTVELNVVPHSHLTKRISDILDIAKPDIVYTHHINDLNLDHSIVARASLVACRPKSGVKKLLMYEIITNTEFSTKPFNPNYYISISSDVLGKKVEAFEYYHTENNKRRNRWRIENQAVTRGYECACDFAEAFQLVRCIE